MTSRLGRGLGDVDVVVFREAPQTLHRVLSSVFFDPQVAHTIVFGVACSVFFAMGCLLHVSSRIWDYTSTYGEDILLPRQHVSIPGVQILVRDRSLALP